MKKAISTIVLFVLLLMPMISALAHEKDLAPQNIDLGNGMVFWMTLPDEKYVDFPRSGLYLNDELIYSIDLDYDWWWATLYFSNDATAFLLVPLAAGGNQVIRFYDNGIFVHEYKIHNDIISGGNESLIQPEGLNTYYRWDFNEKRYYNRDNNILRVVTSENLEITFDLSTGIILSTENLNNMDIDNDNTWRWIVMAVMLLCAIPMFIFFRIYKCRN